MIANPFDLKGQTALITGASRGLGLFMSRALASAGANVVITSRSISSLEICEKELIEFGTRVLALELDVNDHLSIKNTVKNAWEHFGKIEILVNNAGCNIRKHTVDFTWEEWDCIMDCNAKGSFFMMQEMVKRMIPLQYGRIINIGSYTSAHAYATAAPYSASRGAVKQFTMACAADLAPYNITVNSIAPGFFETELTQQLFSDKEFISSTLERIPVNKMGDKNDLDTVVLFLAAKNSKYITGQTIYIDGGLSIGDLHPLATLPKQTIS